MLGIESELSLVHNKGPQNDQADRDYNLSVCRLDHGKPSALNLGQINGQFP